MKKFICPICKTVYESEEEEVYCARCNLYLDTPSEDNIDNEEVIDDSPLEETDIEEYEDEIVDEHDDEMKEDNEDSDTKFSLDFKEPKVKAFFAVGLIVLIAILCFALRNTYIESIDFNNEKIYVDYDGSAQLEYAIMPEKIKGDSLSWSSSDSDIATVSDGVVYGHKLGKCEITATSEKGVKDTVTVYVQYLPDEISLESDTMSIAKGHSEKLKLNIEPNNVEDSLISWTSSDESVATVNEVGAVSAVSLGECTITAESVNGLTAVCNVTVTDETPDDFVKGMWSSYTYYDYKYGSLPYEHPALLIMMPDHTASITIGEKNYDLTWSYKGQSSDGSYYYELTNGVGVVSVNYYRTLDEVWFKLETMVVKCDRFYTL